MKRGFTLLEVLLSTAIISIIIVAVTPLITSAYKALSPTAQRGEMFQTGREAMDKMLREIRQARGFGTISGSGVPVGGYVNFTNKNGQTSSFKRYYDATLGGYALSYSTGAGDVPIAYPVQSFMAVGYQRDSTTETTNPSEISSVKFTLSVSDESGNLNPVTFTSFVYLRKGAPVLTPPIVINEIMYNPDRPAGWTGGWVERDFEWVELYNFSDQTLVLEGWWFDANPGIGTDWQEIFPWGGGTSEVQPYGYAIIVSQNSRVFTPEWTPYFPVSAEATKLYIKKAGLGGGSDIPNNDGELKLQDPAVVPQDRVHYYDNWFGPQPNNNNPDRTTEKTDPLGSSNDPYDDTINLNWNLGPLYGTPGKKNSLTP